MLVENTAAQHAAPEKKPQTLTLLPSLLAGLRVFHGTNLLLEVKRWIERVHPQIWARHGGRDHIWLLNHDEGACWAPSEIWQGIMLTHWGRTDPDHVSMTVRHPKPSKPPISPSFYSISASTCGRTGSVAAHAH